MRGHGDGVSASYAGRTLGARPALSSPDEDGRVAVADLGFVVLTVAAFAVLVFVLRGTERL